MYTSIRKALRLISAGEKLQLYLLFAALVVVAGIDMIGIASIMPFMAVVSDPDVIETNRWLRLTYDFFGFTSVDGFLFFLGMLVFGLLVFGNVVKALTTWATLRFDNRLYATMAHRLLGSYLMRPYEFFLNRNSSEMGKNVLSEVRTVIAGFLTPAMQVLSNGMLAFCILALLMAVNPFIALTIAVVLGAAYGIIYVLARRHLANIGWTQVEANTLKFKAANEVLGGIKDLKILGREHSFLKTFETHAQRHAKANTKSGVISQLPHYALETIAFGGILLIVLFFLGSEKSDKIVPLLALYAFAGYRLLPAVHIIFASISNMRYNSHALEILARDMGYCGTMIDHDLALVATRNRQPLPLRRELLLRNVTYRYPGVRVPAIDDVSLTITRNTCVGFVGGTGSGKTTAVDLILGLLYPTSGQLLVDGTEISGEYISRWQRNLGYVPQHIFLSDDTITRNIAFGVPEHEIDMEAVIRASRIAKLQAFIEEELPNGFDTVIGERGVRLSGGQRQRIGIARALYRDPAVLIMDEATSALDGVTEAAVMKALHTLSREKTVIMIAHRLSTVKDCDVIYLIEHGRIVSEGTYDGLMGSSPWFKAAMRKAP
jgi:ABC-type multidrug transport system fused ATPase/permease subunit